MVLQTLPVDGDCVIDCSYDDVSDFSEGFAIVTINGKRGVVAKDGNLVVPCLYDNIEYWLDMELFVAVVYGSNGACVRYYYDLNAGYLGNGKVQRTEDYFEF